MSDPDHKIWCPLCEGDGTVAFEDGIPRRRKERDEDDLRIEVCPACNGTGIEP